MGWSIATARVERLHEERNPAEKRPVYVLGRHRAITDLQPCQLRLLLGPSHIKQPPSLEDVFRLGPSPAEYLENIRLLPQATKDVWG